MNGIILIDKQSGVTSRDVVDEVGHILKTKRIGHTGTLDPMATGVLVLCVGNATKISDLITSYDKEYVAEVTLGVGTDTLDIEGAILEKAKVEVTKEQVEEVLKTFIGKSEQQVPIYSAVRVNGKRLYEYARKNIEVELPKKNIDIYELSMISDLEIISGNVKFQIKCHVSKGTYIRSLIRDIGLKLNCPACMSSLRRIKQGDFLIEDCYTIGDVESGQYKMLQIKDVLPNISEVIIDSETEKKVKNGAFIDKTVNSDMMKIITESGELIAIYQTYDLDPSKVKPYKMII